MSENQAGAGAQGCYCMGAGPHLSDMLRHFLPESTREHLRASRIEFLKALRSLIDQRIDQLSKTEKKGTSVTVE